MKLRHDGCLGEKPGQLKAFASVYPGPLSCSQGRKYWRVREFEYYDRLTDYIDIYFQAAA